MIKNESSFKKEMERESAEDIALSQAYTLQAVINILERKGLISRDDIFGELEWIEKELDEEDVVNHTMIN